MVLAKTVSSLEKILIRDTFESKAEIKTLKAARGERVSFQLMVFKPIDPVRQNGVSLKIANRSKLSKYISMYRVAHVPSELPAYLERSDDDYISKEPGFYPDVLFPVKDKNLIKADRYNCTSIWYTLELPQDLEVGSYPINITITDNADEVSTKVKVVIEVKNAVIGKSDLKMSQWFHCDCIADHFGVKMMSEKHWKLIENFIKTAAHIGITMLLTPLFTPALDTKIGAERPTMQLVKIEKNGDKYSFNFDLLDRWVNICHKYGIKYFEMSHLFTQWGANACPKIVVKENGKDVKLFGWHVASNDPLYENFLSQFLPAINEHIQKLGIAENCYFHISDEPSDKRENDYDNYSRAKSIVSKYITNVKIMDALSNVAYYDNGLVEYPVPATNHIGPFLERTFKERWCYYCCSQGQDVANRFFAMPSYRNRVSGVQLYMYDMDGFLQWGYNFYYSAGSECLINPFATTDGLQAWPSGDPFSVYPYNNGAIESLRAVVFYEGLQDRLLLLELEKKIGKEKVKQLVLDLAGGELTFDSYPRNAEFYVKLHDTVLDMLD